MARSPRRYVGKSCWNKINFILLLTQASKIIYLLCSRAKIEKKDSENGKFLLLIIYSVWIFPVYKISLWRSNSKQWLEFALWNTRHSATDRDWDMLYALVAIFDWIAIAFTTESCKELSNIWRVRNNIQDKGYNILCKI